MTAGVKKGLDFVVEELANVEEELRTLNSRRRSLINLQSTLARVKREEKGDRQAKVNQSNGEPAPVEAVKPRKKKPRLATVVVTAERESRDRRQAILTYLDACGEATLSAIGRGAGLSVPVTQNLLNQMIEDKHVLGVGKKYCHPNHRPSRETVKS